MKASARILIKNTIINKNGEINCVEVYFITTLANGEFVRSTRIGTTATTTRTTIIKVFKKIRIHFVTVISVYKIRNNSTINVKLDVEIRILQKIVLNECIAETLFNLVTKVLDFYDFVKAAKIHKIS